MAGGKEKFQKLPKISMNPGEKLIPFINRYNWKEIIDSALEKLKQQKSAPKGVSICFDIFVEKWKSGE
jgi:hypothetical protein